LLLTQGGRPQEALAAYDALVEAGHADAAIQQARGDCLQALGRFGPAIEAYDAALAREPGRVEALNNRGAALEALGRLEAALASFDAVLAIKPDHAHAHANRGGVLLALGRAEEALESFDRALGLEPGFAPAHNNRGLALAALLRFDLAVEAYDAALALAPEDAAVWANRSAAQRAAGQLDAALDSAQRALALRPGFADAHNAHGLALAALNRFEEADHSYDRALELAPGHRDALNNSGVALTALGRFDEARARHAAALALDPSYAEAEYNLGLLALRLGDPAGWVLHEARWRRPGQPGPTYPDSHLWLGREDIAGQTLLLHAEQGLGDTIQFARYARRAKGLGARVVLQVQPSLTRLMQGLEGADAVVAVDEPLPPVDRHIPLMSLPRVFGLDGAPAVLHTDPEAVADWRTRLGRGRLSVGLVWAGNAAHGNDRNRSIPLSAFAPLLSRDAAFVSLQREVRAADAATLASSGVAPWPETIADFADTAALVAALDLVVAVDTSVAHLAASLGRSTFLLIPRFPDWRWGEGRTDSPWYPSLRLFRQQQFGRWDEPMTELGAALDAMIAARPA
jgi:tetratricopeptide (TPR) repeat protein